MDPINKRQLLTQVEKDIACVDSQMNEVKLSASLTMTERNLHIVELLTVKVKLYTLADKLISETMEPRPLLPWEH